MMLIGYRNDKRFLGFLRELPTGEWAASLVEDASKNEVSSRTGDLQTCVAFLADCARNLGFETGMKTMARSVRAAISNQGPY